MFQSVPTEEEKLLEAIKETPSISRAELSKRLKISERQVRKITDQLREKGVLIREGGNSGKWIINSPYYILVFQKIVPKTHKLLRING